MPNPTETYLQRAWSDSIDNITLNDVRVAIEEVKEMDEEHGAFWVGVITDHENVLEVDKELQVTAVFEDNAELSFKKKAKDWNEVTELYDLFLKGNFDSVKSLLTEK